MGAPNADPTEMTPGRFRSPLLQLLEEPVDFRKLRVSRLRKGQVEPEDVPRLVAQFHITELNKGLEKKTRPSQKGQ